MRQSSDRVRRGVLLVLLLLVAARPADAQLTEATLNGTVVDADGRGIPAAIVEVVHTGTGAKRTTTADDTGVFTIAGLPQGSYDVEGQSPGFATIKQTGLRLSVG